MYRREALRRFAAVGGATTLAGCGTSASTQRDAPRPPEAPEDGGPSDDSDVPNDGLAVGGINYQAADSGNLVVVVTIQNGGGQTRSGTLTTTVAIGGERLSESTDVTVEADDSAEFEVPFDVSFDTFEQDGSINLDLD